MKHRSMFSRKDPMHMNYSYAITFRNKVKVKKQMVAEAATKSLLFFNANYAN
jgi:hypothetical protein